MSLNFANKITIGRILAVPFFIATVLYYSSSREYLRFTALSVFLFAVISDMIDGYVARQHEQKTKAGMILDPLADKILLISAFLCIYKMGLQYPGMHLPIWLVVIVISRDIILLMGGTLLFIMYRSLTIEATIWGKASTFFQVIAIICLLLFIPIPTIGWSIVIILTIVSGVDYLRQGIKVINAN